MPSKQFFMDLKSSEAALNYAVEHFSVDPTMRVFKILSNGQKQVTLRSGQEDFYGAGNSKLEAVAEALSNKFPE
jgi:hypothetical protein